jgi:predicted glycosyltransferase
MAPRRTVLLYCQHATGIGHLVRSFALATALAEHYRVVLLSGGALPKELTCPPRVEIEPVAPLGLVDGRLVSHDRRRTVERAQRLRLEKILATQRALRPDVLLIELFPFGRRKFAFELLPLLDEVRNRVPPTPLVLCSLRDILVGRDDQQEFDELAVARANRYFHAILVHADPTFARLEDTLHPRTPNSCSLHGFRAGR